jgi:hypothetical protein
VAEAAQTAEALHLDHKDAFLKMAFSWYSASAGMGAGGGTASFLERKRGVLPFPAKPESGRLCGSKSHEFNQIANCAVNRRGVPGT